MQADYCGTDWTVGRDGIDGVLGFSKAVSRQSANLEHLVQTRESDSETHGEKERFEYEETYAEKGERPLLNRFLKYARHGARHRRLEHPSS